MNKIALPFKPEFKDALLSGRKTRTCRTTKKGKAGDIFEAFGARFVITMIQAIELRTVRDTFYEDEGCPTPQHSRKGFDPDQVVTMHTFEKLDGDAHA